MRVSERIHVQVEGVGAGFWVLGEWRLQREEQLGSLRIHKKIIRNL